jgi:C4-dicarboxylate-specific signal transduction histidine kinase
MNLHLLLPPTCPPALQSYLGYHCRKSDYRQACKTAFRLWGETLQFTLIQTRQKQLRAMQEEQKAMQEEQRRKSDAERAQSSKARARRKKSHHPGS